MKEGKLFFNKQVAETATKEIAGIAVYFFSYYTWVRKSIYLDDTTLPKTAQQV
jgi:hypothetical protein